MPLFLLIFLLVFLGACNGEIYLRDGVTDGDTFYLAERALGDDDPALQSWVAYSLSLSVCKLEIGGDNPARASTFDCEVEARRQLVERWGELGLPGSNAYLDALAKTGEAGLLREYVAHYHGRRQWTLPDDLEERRFREFRRTELAGHRPQTRIIGSWNFARNVREAL